MDPSFPIIKTITIRKGEITIVYNANGVCALKEGQPPEWFDAPTMRVAGEVIRTILAKINSL